MAKKPAPVPRRPQPAPRPDRAAAASPIRNLLWCGFPLLLLLLVEYAGFALARFQVTGDTINDPDTLTRLAYLREVMARHSWDHGYFGRLNAPYGMRLHWALPFNVILLGIIRIFSLFVPQTALHYAGYWTGPIFRVLMVPASYWAGRVILSPTACAFATGMILFSPSLLEYSHRGAANYHSLMLLDAVLMAGLTFRAVKRPNASWIPLAFGVMAGFCLWTTVELVILVGPLLFGLFVLWIAQGASRARHLMVITGAFSITMSIALLVESPVGGVGAVAYDRPSALFQTLAALPFIMALGTLFLSLETPLSRFRYFILSGIAAAIFLLACYPSAVHGVAGNMDPYVVREWLSTVREVKPITDWHKIAIMLGPGLLCLLLLIKWKNKAYREPVMIGIGLLYLLAHLHIRLSGYVVIVSAYCLGFIYDSLRRRDGQFPVSLSRYARPGAVGLLAILYVFQVGVLVFQRDITQTPVIGPIRHRIACNPYGLRTVLDDEKWMGVGKTDPIIANQIDDASTLLYWTHLRFLAGNYHTDNQGIKDDYQFFRDMGDDFARKTVRERGIDFVLLCGNNSYAWYSFTDKATAEKELPKPENEFHPQQTLYTRLANHQPPPWLTLRPWPKGLYTDMLLYQVDKSKLGSSSEP